MGTKTRQDRLENGIFHRIMAVRAREFNLSLLVGKISRRKWEARKRTLAAKLTRLLDREHRLTH